MSKPKAAPNGKESRKALEYGRSIRAVYPFSGIVGQDEMKLGLILNVIDPSIGGVLMMGHRGTGKSTAVRALANLLPEIRVVRGCRFNCEPEDPKGLCDDCAKKLATENRLQRKRSAVPVVDLPLGATEDRVCGAIDIQRALSEGIKAFEPGLLARANRGFLYIDEVNLLEDHLVDLLLDVSTTGRNKVERENISVEHPARFVLIGSGNPEEGELRPQLLDRFGLYIEVKTENGSDKRVEIVEKREAFERNAEKFCAAQEDEQKQLRHKLARAGKNFANVKVERTLLRQIASLCSELKVDGHRGELTIMRAARALAAFEGRQTTREEDVRRVATMALRHRLHRDALSEAAGGVRIEQALDKVFADRVAVSSGGGEGDNPGEGNPPTNGAKKSRNERSFDQDGRKGTDFEIELPSPAALNAHLQRLSFDDSSKLGGKNSVSRSRRVATGRVSYNSQRGRYARALSSGRIGARIALDATLRALVRDGYRVTSAGSQASEARKPDSGVVSLDIEMMNTNNREFGRIPNRHPTPDIRHPVPPDSRHTVRADALRFKEFSRKAGTLFIFAIDTSGSMALNRISQAKGALLDLLRQSYINRDTVAIIGFRGAGADELLPPSRSNLRARRVLDSLSVGGGTPVSAGLACALGLAERAANQEHGEVVLLLFSDGGANVPLRPNAHRDRRARQKQIESEVSHLGSRLRSAGVQTVVVATHNRFVSNGQTHTLAKLLGARHCQLLNGGSPG